jgi:DNA processing protein
VLEAGWRSGSLNTAGHAAALGRPLGAVPGPVTSVASAGCHRLIRDFDAVCVTTADEMAELAPLDVVATAPDAAPAPGGQANLTAEQLRIRDALSARSARLVDDVAARSGLSVATVQGVLGAMQLEGTAVERASGWVRTNSSSASQAAAN